VEECAKEDIEDGDRAVYTAFDQAEFIVAIVVTTPGRTVLL